MWHDGRPAEDQCVGVHLQDVPLNELDYLHARDVTYAVLCEGSYEESPRYRDFMGYLAPWYRCRKSPWTGSIADGYFGFMACDLRDGDQVYETYWTTGRGWRR